MGHLGRRGTKKIQVGGEMGQSVPLHPMGIFFTKWQISTL